MRRPALLLLVLLVTACSEKKTADQFPQAPVILISVDTLRADHLPAYGYEAVETPHLDALRSDGVLFTNAYAQVPLTLPSHTTILTGLLPQDHGVRNNIGYRLDGNVPTAAKIFHEAGYDTGAAVSAYVLRGATGLRDQFDFYDDAIANRPGEATGNLQRDGHTTAALAKEWIAKRGEKPFFFMLHLFEPHSPYEAPEPFRSKYASVPYDGEIAAADDIVGDFLADLKSRGIYDRAIIIFFSDHGEGLMQHGEPEHGIFLYREAIHVPLIVKLPKNARAGETIASPVGLVDILPTITSLTGAKPPAKIDGVSLFAQQPANRALYSETLYPRIHLGWSELRSLQGEQFHFIQAPRPELYDTSTDPAETKNVLTDQRRVYASMKAELDKYGTEASIPKNVDPEEAKKLAALGYLGSTAAATDGPLPDPKDRIGEIAEITAAANFVRAGRDEEAIAAFRSVLAKNPRISDAWTQLALVLEKHERLEEASEAYRTAIEQAPDLAGEFALSRGSVLLRLEKYDEAAKHAELGMKINPGNAHLLLARIALAQHRYADAEREARTSQKEAGSYLAASVVLAQAFAEQERAQEALPILAETEERARREAAYPVETLDAVRGDALARLQRFPEAIEAFRRSIDAFPNERSAYSRLAIVYALTGRPDESRAVLAEMVRKIPTPGAKRLAEKTRRELGI
jgi:arylsulfatase A-like enzyme/tetratricopeptide (TPR) repeat protein